MDSHVDFGMSYSFTESLYAGAAAYLYKQVSPDTGGSARLGDFRSSVAGVGPQIGWSLTGGNLAFDVSLRGYKEFDAQNRPEGLERIWRCQSVPFNADLRTDPDVTLNSPLPRPQ